MDELPLLFLVSASGEGIVETLIGGRGGGGGEGLWAHLCNFKTAPLMIPQAS